MNYTSTRDSQKSAVLSAEAILTGLSPDGGLYVPCSIPQITLSDIEKLKDMSYIERAKWVLEKYLTDFSADELDQCVVGAYGGGNFGHGDVAPVVKLSDSAYVLELWHGPTCAFKDMALQILPRFLTCSMKKMGETRTTAILVATSGDTGKAALEGFKDVDGTKILVFYPSDGVSDIQKLQMITQDGGNVMVSAIRGNFDDAQNGVKEIFTDNAAIEKLDERGYVLSSANSINWGRLVPQIVYYVSAYCDMVKSGEIALGDKINVCVPTGNFGNILAAYYAKMMGVPIGKLICASNENDVLTEFINTGKYDKNRKFHTTMSPSMDILISSNLERLLYALSESGAADVNALMKSLSDNGSYQLDEAMKSKVSELLWAGSADDKETLRQIAKTFGAHKYLADTHTAVAINVYEQYVAATGDKTKTIIASTASPYKFGDSVLAALDVAIDGKDDFEQASLHQSRDETNANIVPRGMNIADMDDFQKLDLLCKISGMAIPPSLSELKGKEKKYTQVVDKGEMDKVVYEFLT